MKKKSEIKILLYCYILILLFVLVGLFFILGRIHKNITVSSGNIIRELKISAKKKKIKLNDVSINVDNDIIAYADNIKILFSTEKDIEKQTQALQKILKGTKINKTISVIDFRFNKIVVR